MFRKFKTNNKLSIAALTISATTAFVSSAAVADSPLTLDNDALDTITGAGPVVEVNVTASGSGRTSGRTNVNGFSASSANIPVRITIANGSAIACCGMVATSANANATVTQPGRFPFSASIDQTVSGLGFSVSFGAAVALNAF